jgi:hypothetical protein
MLANQACSTDLRSAQLIADTLLLARLLSRVNQMRLKSRVSSAFLARSEFGGV